MGVQKSGRKARKERMDLQSRRAARRQRDRKRKMRFLYIVGLMVPTVLLILLVGAMLGDMPPGERRPSSAYAAELFPGPAYGEEQAAPSLTLAGEDGDAPWYLRLVNATHPLPDGWDPELTVIDANTGEEFDSRAIEYLNAMLADMEREGLRPLVCSGYRSYGSQVEIFESNVEEALAQGYTREEAEQQAALWVMPPGCSEHQSGLAADIVSEDNQRLDGSQDHTPEQQWLHANCQEYGFILRYPEDKTELTGVNYEPWHYRYVGVDAARAIMGQGLCLEEYS